MTALALILAGCSSNEDDVKIDKEGTNKAVPIQISQKVAGVETKAAITTGSKMEATIIMVDAGTDSSTDSPDFDNFTPRKENEITENSSKGGAMELQSDDKRATVATAEFEAKTEATSITLNPTLYYPVSTDSKKTWILGVAPQGTVDNTKVTFTDVDGLQDVMYAKQQEAGSSSSDGKKTPALEFEHKTTQLLFVAKLTKELTGTEWADKYVSVTSITIQKAQVPTAILIKDGTLESKEMSLTVAGCNAALTTDPCDPSIPVMIKPSTSLMVNILLKVGDKTISYNNLKVQKSEGGGDLATFAAKSHLITFEITPPIKAGDGTAIEATAKVQPWTTGDAGKVEIK